MTCTEPGFLTLPPYLARRISRPIQCYYRQYHYYTSTGTPSTLMQLRNCEFCIIIWIKRTTGCRINPHFFYANRTSYGEAQFS